MATVQSVINSARYDLRDYQKGILFDNDELLNYMNRMIGIMDSTLASLNSDLVEDEDTTIATSTDQSYVDLSSMNSGLWDSIRSVWISTDEKRKIGIDEMRNKRRWYSSSSGEPQYWCLSGQNLLFEQDADDAYDLVIYYNKKTATLALTDNMPYNSFFDEFLREMVVLHAHAKKEGRVSRPDSMYYDIFKGRAMQEQLRRDWVKRPYWLGY